MSMTIRELISELEGFEEQYGDLDVRLAQQPSWPFEYSIDKVEVVDVSKPSSEEVDAQDPEHVPNEEPPTMIVYLVEGEQLRYLPAAVQEEIGWGR